MKKTEAGEDAMEQNLTIILILNANKNQFANFRDECSNSFQTYKKNLYPRYWK